MKSVTYIISNINKAIAFEWITAGLSKDKIQLTFILLNPGTTELEQFFKANSIPVVYIRYSGKKDIFRAFIKVLLTLFQTRPDIIHCHMFDACLIGLSAGWLCRIKKRIFTRHSGSYNWEYNRKGLKYDRLMAFFATDIVAISQNVRQLLIKREGVVEKKVKLIPHGFKLEEFQNESQGDSISIRKKYNGNKKQPVVGVISRWMHLKGIQYIIPAFKKLLTDYPNALLILANANGPYKNEIQSLLDDLPQESFVTIPFENDLFALYQLFDIFIHVPINPTIEAFGQTYVEALAAGIPSIFTLSGVASEFIEPNKNALVVPFCDSEAIYVSAIRLLADNNLQNNLRHNGKESVSKFALKNMIIELENMYLN